MRTTLSIFIAFFILVLCISACGYKESVVMADTKSYIWFSGRSEGVTATLDDHPPFDLAPSFYVDPQGDKKSKTAPVHYEVDPGKHTITLLRNGQVILERTLLLGNHMTMEIEIP